MENPFKKEVLLGKSSINEPFSIAMLNYQRVYWCMCEEPCTPGLYTKIAGISGGSSQNMIVHRFWYIPVLFLGCAKSAKVAFHLLAAFLSRWPRLRLAWWWEVFSWSKVGNLEWRDAETPQWPQNLESAEPAVLSSSSSQFILDHWGHSPCWDQTNWGLPSRKIPAQHSTTCGVSDWIWGIAPGLP